MDRKVELLAPAGNVEGFYGAIHAGADAVYLGGERFGARAYADNFTTKELLACIRYAHIHGRRVYLTVNTLVKETEFDSLFPYLLPLYENGLDGVIVQDLGVFSFIREHFPAMGLHVSTQMTLTGRYGAGLLKKLGAARVVPARELGLGEIIELKKAAGLEVETFIHGAMCYCYSGQCLFSSMLGGRSGNRGRCAQPCRLPYRVEGAQSRRGAGAECYPLSLKDMCTIEHIPEFIEAGIDSFKIEGRMKKPEYAAGVTAIYRKYIDRYYAGEDCAVSGQDLETLGRLYIRSERQDGYYYRHNGRDMVTLKNPSYSGCSDELAEEIRSRYLAERPRIDIRVQAAFRVGEPAALTLACGRAANVLAVTVEGDAVAPAQKQPVTRDNVCRQLGKLGDTVFAAQEIELALDEDAFYPLKGMNELRRRAVAELEELLIRENGFPVRRFPVKRQEVRVPQAVGASLVHRGWHVLLRTKEQLDALAESVAQYPAIRRVYLEAGLVCRAFAEEAAGRAAKEGRCLRERLQSLCVRGCVPVIALPPVIRSRDAEFLTELLRIYDSNRALFGGFLARSMDGLGFLAEQSDIMQGRTGGGTAPAAVYGDAGVYVWNRESLRLLQGLALLDGFCLPYELKASDQRKLVAAAGISCEKVVYGRIPLMITANCIVNTVYGCAGGGEEALCFLIDRYRKRFPALTSCRHCMNTIYNSLPLSLHGELSKWRDAVDFRLDFTIEDGRETARILQYFMSGAKGDAPYGEYTTGHEKRGAE